MYASTVLVPKSTPVVCHDYVCEHKLRGVCAQDRMFAVKHNCRGQGAYLEVGPSHWTSHQVLHRLFQHPRMYVSRTGRCRNLLHLTVHVWMYAGACFLAVSATRKHPHMHCQLQRATALSSLGHTHTHMVEDEQEICNH